MRSHRALALLLSVAGCGQRVAAPDPDGPALDARPRSEALEALADVTVDMRVVPCALDPALPPVRLGAVVQVNYPGAPAMAPQEAERDSLQLLRKEINTGCGTIGTPEHGAALELSMKDCDGNPAWTDKLTVDLIQKDQAVAVLGAPDGVATTIPSATAAIARGVPFGAYTASGEELTGCTAAQLADPDVTKSSTPIFQPGTCWDHKNLLIRTTPRYSVWGGTAASYLRAVYPWVKQAVVFHRDSSFGVAIRDGFTTHFEVLGGNTSATVAHAFQSSKADFIPLLKAALASGPQALVWASGLGTDFKSMLEAYVELDKDPKYAKPPGYGSILFVAPVMRYYGLPSLSDEARMVAADRLFGLEPAWDPASEGFKRWYAAYKSFRVDNVFVIHTLMRVYDAAMILALAITRANSTDPAKIKAAYREVANPPGETIYPGEWAKARALLMQGRKINYEGASGSCDLTESGEILSTPFEVWSVDAQGKAQSVGVYHSTD